jgi:hypothetical protein
MARLELITRRFAQYWAEGESYPPQISITGLTKSSAAIPKSTMDDEME